MQMTGKMQAMSARRFIGKNVVDTRGERVGEIEDLVLNAQTGCTTFAIVATGGFMGMGEDHHVVPWQALSMGPQMDMAAVNVDRDKLMRSPKFDRGNPPDWTDETWMKSVYEYYGVQMPEMSMAGAGMGTQGGTMGGGGGMGGQGM